jgi:hypothetical protein
VSGSNHVAQHRAATALDQVLAARRGEDWIDRLATYYQHPWCDGEPERRLARMLADLRAAGYDVRGAMDMAETDLRAIEADVPVRAGAVRLIDGGRP